MKISKFKCHKIRMKKAICRIISFMMILSIMEIGLVYSGVCQIVKASSTKTLSGKVTDYDTGQPIEGAIITFDKVGGIPALTTLSKSDGTYSLDNAHNGNSVVYASKDGYQDEEITGFKVNQNDTLDIRLKRKKPLLLSKPVLTPNTTEPTNQNVTITISNWGDAPIKEYRVNGGAWQNYTNPVVMITNGLVEARGRDVSNNTSETGSLNITNIYIGKPPAPTWVESTPSSSNVNSKVTAVFPAWARNKQISLNGGAWTTYSGDVELSKKAMIRARYQDAAGNTSYIGTIDEANGDWASKNVTRLKTSEADLMVRTGDIDNFGYTWEYEKDPNYNPFSGNPTKVHAYPWTVPSDEPSGVDRIMVVSSYDYSKGTISENGYAPKTTKAHTDGYTSSTRRPNNNVQAINLNYNLSGIEVKNATLQMFVDDFQAGNSRDTESQVNYIVTINGVKIDLLSDQINSLDQSGPIGKLITMEIPKEFIDLVKTGSLSIKIDDPVVRINGGDGYAIDFVKLIVNKKTLSNTGTVTGVVKDSVTKQPISGVKISAASGLVETTTDSSGKYTLKDVPAGLASIKATKSGYEDKILNKDVVADNSVTLDFELISTAKPGKPVIRENPVTPTNKDVTVTVDYPDNPSAKKIFYKGIAEDTATWHDYIGPVTIGENQTIRAYSIPVTGEQYKSDEATFDITNIDKTMLPAPILTASNTNPTNNPVIVTAVFSDGAKYKQISIDGGLTWKDYTSAISLIANASVQARQGRNVDWDSNIQWSPIAYLTVSNISPAKPTFTQDPTTKTKGEVTVSVAYPSSAVVKEISKDNGSSWEYYTDPIVLYDNATIKARCKDAAGVGSESELNVNNIDKIPPTAQISYTINPDRSVTATLVKESEHITITNNGGSRTYIFANPGDFTFEFVDDVGNRGSTTATFARQER